MRSENGWKEAFDARQVEQAAIAEQAAPAGEAVANREADRQRFPDVAFNLWLDEGISDAGHIVWDSLNDVCDAWHGWNSRKYYAIPQPAECKRCAELTADRDSADAFSKYLADICEKAEAQVIALMEDKARAEAVIEKCKEYVEMTAEDFPKRSESLLYAIADYQKGVK